jgi:26S proteasome regulatory subunit N13
LQLMPPRSATASPTDASSIIQDFLKSMSEFQPGRPTSQGNPFTTLPDLLTTASTVPLVDSADESTIDRLLEYLPPVLIGLAQQARGGPAASMEASCADSPQEPLSQDGKKGILRRVLQSPQFAQSLSSLTVALWDGGLPSISEALNINVHNGGYMRRGGMPLGGGDAVEAFLNGVKDKAQSNGQAKNRTDHD